MNPQKGDNLKSTVREYFKRLYQEMKKEQRPNRQTRSKRRVGMKPDESYEIGDITDFPHFIECEVAPNICPMLWEILEIDFSDKNKRYCNICEKYVYKANSLSVLEKLKSEDKCIAISNYILEKINGKTDDRNNENLESRLAISKLFMIDKKYYSNIPQFAPDTNYSYEEQLKKFLLYVVTDQKLMDDYLSKDVDLKYIFRIVCEFSNDEDFKNKIMCYINL